MAGGVLGEEDLTPACGTKQPRRGVVDALQDNTSAGALHPPLVRTLTLNKAIIIEFHLNE